MPFDWKAFLESRNIEYISEGKNVKAGNVNIHCPLCGGADPSEHMGLNLTTGHWGCWRDRDHRGVTPHRLIKALTGCTHDEAKEIAGSDAPVRSSIGELRKRFEMLGSAVSKKRKLEVIEMPAECLRLTHASKRGGFIRYLEGRGFDYQLIRKATHQFNLRYCMFGEFGSRIVIPVYHGVDKRLVALTGRSIQKKTGLRYLTKPDGDAIKRTLLNHSRACSGGEVLLVVEGPLDTINFQVRAPPEITVTCLFGTAWTDRQLTELFYLTTKHNKTFILFDNKAYSQARTLATLLSIRKVRALEMPSSFDDPGDMDTPGVEKLSRRLLANV